MVVTSPSTRAGLDGFRQGEGSRAIKKRKMLWESLREQEIQVETKFSPESVGYKQPPPQEKGFAASTAAVAGMSKTGAATPAPGLY